MKNKLIGIVYVVSILAVVVGSLMPSKLLVLGGNAVLLFFIVRGAIKLMRSGLTLRQMWARDVERFKNALQGK